MFYICTSIFILLLVFYIQNIKSCLVTNLATARGTKFLETRNHLLTPQMVLHNEGVITPLSNTTNAPT